MSHLRAYSSSCSQVVLVCVYPFRCNSPYCNRKSQKNTRSSYMPCVWQDCVISWTVYIVQLVTVLMFYSILGIYFVLFI